jgi:hypothetical protein
MSELKPCLNSKCDGGTESLYLERDERVTRKWLGSVHCDWCGMLGPTGDGEAEAIELWNSLPRVLKEDREEVESLQADNERLRKEVQTLQNKITFWHLAHARMLESEP